MARYDFDMGIIGGGAAGLTVAAGAAQLGVKVLLVDKAGRLGGDCLHYGCVPSKTLLHSAHVYHEMRHASRLGLPQPAVEPVDFSRIAARISDVIETIQHHDSEERFCGLGVKVVFGQAQFCDEHTVSIDGTLHTAKYWLIATGSRPAVPPVNGLSGVSCLTNEQIFSLQTLPESLIVLGGGPIGIEMAQAFARLGSRVEVIQRQPQILAKEDADMAAIVMQAMEEEGVVFHLGAQIAEVREASAAKEVDILCADGRQHTVRGTAILVALGRSPNVEDLGLENAGVAYTAHGISVDARMRTSCVHIFAAGDCTGKFQFTHAAGYEGGIVLANAVFRLPRKAQYTNLPWCTYTSPELASIGYNEKTASDAGLAFRVYKEPFAANDRALAEARPQGCIKLLMDTKGRPLGVQIAGQHAGELINEWVAILNAKIKPSVIAGAVHPYPTLAEINKRVTGNYLGQKLFSDKVRKILHLLFRYQGSASCDNG